MARRCELTGKGPRTGLNVSHSRRRTKRVFRPNLKRASFPSDALGTQVTLRVSTRAIRTVTRKGGLDAFLRQTPDAKLPPEALRLKRRIGRARSRRAAAAQRSTS
ncbi:MAG: 50S ribosomal protein L28 [Myxococcota bacterium]